MELVHSPITVEHALVVQDNEEILKELKSNRKVSHWEYGHSMSPMIKNKEYCVIEPLNPFGKLPEVGDAVFCRVSGCLMVHMVWMISNCGHGKDPYYLIGTTSGQLYGWTNEVYGIAHGTDIFEDVNDPSDD